jgi:hypothetical protein
MCRSLIALAVLAVAACQGGRDDGSAAPTTEAAAPGPSARFQPTGGPLPALAVTVTDQAAGHCTVTIGDRQLEARVTAEALSLGDAEQPEVRGQRDAAGLAVTLEGQPLGRVPAPTASAPLSVIDAIGVPMFRIRLDGDDVVVRDAAGMPTLILQPASPSAFTALAAADRTELGTVVTGDRLIAALLATGAADPRVRTLLACERLLAVAP